ncbi:hypothetical protein BN1708_009173 [Verticillium longisporum]|uniref:Uncharacterized protein n=1 Tax=Verticillium longisporum TaxID=100787 RepID=A0A0G4KFC6_VERLO|nr:hypothetical protein BN1708_009173 [Verticillium longisporum]
MADVKAEVPLAEASREASVPSTTDEKPKDTKLRPEREPTFKDYIRVFSYATKWDIVIYVFAAVSSIGSGTTLPLMNVIFGQLVSQFTGYFSMPPTTSRSEFEALLDKQALYIMALFIGRLTLTYINKFCFRLIGIRLSSAIRLHYIESLFGQSIHVLDSMPPGAAAGTITTTANVLQLGLSEKLGTFMEYNGTIFTAIIVAFTWSWELTLVTSSVLLFLIFVLGVILPFLVKGQSAITQSEARATAVASEAFSSIRMLTACGAEERITSRYDRWVDDARRKGQATAPLLATQLGLIFFGIMGAFGLAFWHGTTMRLNGSIDDAGVIIIVIMSVIMVVISLERIATPLVAVTKAMVAACEFFTVIDAPKPPTGTLKEPDVSADQDIVFDHVTFAYPSRPHVKVLDGLNLRIEKGLNTAIVGPSGSGKSTIVGLIQRWYSLNHQYVIAKTVEKDKKKEAQKKKKLKKGITDSDEEEPVSPPEETGPAIELSGSVTTCGRSLDDIELKWWRCQIGLVQQEPFLFNDTIFKNVANGLIGTPWEHESEETKRQLVKEACEESFANEFIDRLPEGYDTQVGDSGAKLSGGQRQRIAIARSIVRKPKIVILDEATSAIDVRGEKIVQAALDRVARNRTTITIAHRLSTIKKADKIIVLKKGQVMEQGTHHSLLEDENGLYYGLVHAQQLSLGEPTEANTDDSEEDLNTILQREKSAAYSEAEQVDDKSKDKSPNLFSSYGKLIVEQRARWLFFIIIILAAMGGASSTPLQAWLLAQVLNAALDRVARNRTTITIAHRLSTIKKADKIIVLKKGQVMEQGTHHSLLEDENGLYYGLVHAQQLSLGEPTEANTDDSEEDLNTILQREKSAAYSEAEQVNDKSNDKSPNLFSSYGKLIVEQRARWLFFIIIILAAMGGASSTPLQAWLLAQVLNVFTIQDPGEIRSEGNFWSLMWAVLAIGVGVSYFSVIYSAVFLQYRISAVYKRQYFGAILFQRTSFFDQEENSQGSLTARVSGDPKQLEELLGINIAFLLMGMLQVIGALSVAFAFGWKLALVATFVTMPIGMFSAYWRFKYEMQFDQMNGAVFAESAKFAAEAIGAFRTVSALTLEDTINRRYGTLLNDLRINALKKAWLASFIVAFAESSGLGCQGLIFWYGGRLLASREYDMVTFFVCFMAAIQGAEAAGQALSFGPNAAQASAAASRIIKMRDSRNLDEHAESATIPDTEGGVKIELRDAHFKYPTRNVSVFKGINLTVEKGQFAALVGASGCGKTSIVSLMERFYDLTQGDILCNGKSIYDLNIYEYRKALSLVAQEPNMFQGTIRENILLGIDGDVPDEQLHAVCRDASIHDFIVSLPEGYNTDIGSKGVSLSGGQKQRIAIARALVRDPKILLLDEATSSLDSESEKLVQAAFERASKGRTMLVVAHRLATVQNADVIFVMGEGKVLEKGNHVELLKKKGVYWHMCQSQALDR